MESYAFLNICGGVINITYSRVVESKFGTPSPFFWLPYWFAPNLNRLSEYLGIIPYSHKFKQRIFFTGIKVALNHTKNWVNTYTTLMTVSKRQTDKLSSSHLVIILTVESSQA